MAEQIEGEPLAQSLINLLDKCELTLEEPTYPAAANVFSSVEMALTVVQAMTDISDGRQPLFRALSECFGEIPRY